MSETLLRWYDAHARELPWRVSPAQGKAGRRPDPYAVWLSEVMLQQTTVAAVRGYFDRFRRRWPDIQHLAAAEDSEVMAAWAGLGYYARARNLLKCARVVRDEMNGRFPADREALQKLPGIGPYTAAAIAAIAFDRPETVVDGNVERVMARLFDVEVALPGAKPALALLASGLTPPTRAGDYAQAVMDLGAVICMPKTPACGGCPWRAPCKGRTAGRAAELPRRAPKAAKPTRYGLIYIARRADGAWLLERRPDKGLLGGMLGWPGSDWSATPRPAPPIGAAWRDIGAEVRHTFTHFHLRLSVHVARTPQQALPRRGQFIADQTFRASNLPTVMGKAFALARAALLAD